MAVGDKNSLQVKNAAGITKNLSVLTGFGDIPESTLIPVHYIAGMSGALGDALTSLSASIATDGGGVKHVRITGSLGSSIDVQTTAEAALTASSVVANGSATAAVIGSGDAGFDLAKTLTVTIVNRTNDVVYIKLHTSSSSAPTILASSTDFSYVLDSYSTYEAQAPNAKLWHSYVSVDTANKVAVTYTRT